MLIAMALTAFACVFIGIFPDFLYALLPFAVDYTPYTVTHVITQLQLLMFSALAFTFLMLTRVYPPELRSVNLDFDWTYRKFLPIVIEKALLLGSYCQPRLAAGNKQQIKNVVNVLYKHHGPEGRLARTWPTGSMVLWVAVLLAVCLIFLLRVNSS